MTVFGFIGMLIGVAVIALPIFIIASWFQKGKPMFCADCGTEAPAKLRTKGSIVIEIILWLCLLVPGLIYSVWRHTSRANVCSSCGSERLLPPNSPMAIKLRTDLQPRQAA